MASKVVKRAYNRVSRTPKDPDKKGNRCTLSLIYAGLRALLSERPSASRVAPSMAWYWPAIFVPARPPQVSRDLASSVSQMSRKRLSA